MHKSLVRCHLEYANSVWNPYRPGLINDLEKVQMRATKLHGSNCQTFKVQGKTYTATVTNSKGMIHLSKPV